MTDDALAALPDGWPDGFGEDERDFLYEESRQRLIETLDAANRQEARALDLARISLAIIAASGIFGELTVEVASPFEWSLLVWASALAIISSAAVGVLAFWILHPRAWATGTNVDWLARWSGASLRDLKDASLEGLGEGFRDNSTIIRGRGGPLTWLLWAVACQTLCVVLVEVVAAADSVT